MVPVITRLEAAGLAVEPLWWALALAVGFGGNGSPYRGHSHCGGNHIERTSRLTHHVRHEVSIRIRRHGHFVRGGNLVFLLILGVLRR